MHLSKYDQMFKRYYNLDNPNEIEVMDKVTNEAREILGRCKEYFSLNNKLRDKRIIVSVTSIPERLQSVIYPIQCMLIQTVKPDKIILWLDTKRLRDELLPQELLDLKKYGLKICYVEDIGPHTKYYYAMQQYSDDIIITIDDDLIYQRTLVEGLIESYKKNPKCVCSYWVWQMKYTHNGIPYPSSEYLTANEVYNDKPCDEFVALGFGGVLYPPHCLHTSAFDIENIRNLAFKADDVWLKAMEALNGVQVVKAPGRHFYPHITNSQIVALKYENLTGGNDIAIKNVFLHYNMIRQHNNGGRIENDKVKTLLKWIKAYQKHLKLSEYLLQKDISTVAIYGMGQLGKLVVSELQGSDVKVLYGIDKKIIGTFGNISIVKPEAVNEVVDLVIMTAPVSYDEISTYIKFNIISLEDLLVEMEFYSE